MKSPLIALSAVVLSACTAAPARVSLGTPVHHVDPANAQILAGYKWVEFPVRVTNISPKTVWYFGQFANWPPVHYNFIRPSGHWRWVDQTQLMCGLGAGFHPLLPGASLSFSEPVPADDAGKQVRIDVSIYLTPQTHARPIVIHSPATLIP